MADRDIVATLSEQVGLALAPFASASATPGGLRDFLETLGWLFPTPPASVSALGTPIGEVAGIVEPGDVSSDQVPALLAALGAAVGAIADLQSASDVPDEFKAEFPRQLLDYLVVEYLFLNQPAWAFFLYAIGIVRFEPVEATGERPAFTRRVFALEDLDDLFSDPLTYLKTGYQWDTPDFEGDRLTASLRGLLDAWGLPVRERPVASDQTLAALTTVRCPGWMSSIQASRSCCWKTITTRMWRPASDCSCCLRRPRTNRGSHCSRLPRRPSIR